MLNDVFPTAVGPRTTPTRICFSTVDTPDQNGYFHWCTVYARDSDDLVVILRKKPIPFGGRNTDYPGQLFESSKNTEVRTSAKGLHEKKNDCYDLCDVHNCSGDPNWP